MSRRNFDPLRYPCSQLAEKAGTGSGRLLFNVLDCGVGRLLRHCVRQVQRRADSQDLTSSARILP